MMTTERGEEVLLEAAATAFEGLAFAFLFPDPEVAAACDTPADAVAAVRFAGPYSGTLRVRIGGGVLPGLAANMLGEDEPPAEPLQQDALAELANVICGTALPTLAGDREVFRLEAPTVCADFPGDLSTALLSARMAVDEGWAEVLFFFDSPHPFSLGIPA